MLTRAQLNTLFVVYAKRRETFYKRSGGRGRGRAAFLWRVAWWYELGRWSKALQDYEAAQRGEGSTNHQERS